VENDISEITKRVNELAGIKESDTGLGPPAMWDLAADKQTLQSEQPLQVARCTKIINADTEDAKYIINVKQFAKFVVDLNEQVASTDIEEGMRVGVDRNKYQIHIPLPPKIDPSVTMMQVEEKPDVTYSDVGGCKEQIEKLREVVETPLLHPERFVTSVSSLPREFCCTAHPELAKPFAHALSPTGQTPASSESSGQNSFKNTSEKAPGWSGNCSKWPEPRRLA